MEDIKEFIMEDMKEKNASKIQERRTDKHTEGETERENTCAAIFLSMTLTEKNRRKRK